MRLLVTRPQPDATETAAQLEALGHTAIVDPLTTIAFLPPPDIAFRPAAVAFTSSNGVRAAARWPASAAWRDIAVFAVGEKTGAEARRFGFADVRVASGGLPGLVAVIVKVFAPAAGRLVHVGGRDRAGDLEGDLKARGFDAVTVEGYSAEAVPEIGVQAREALASDAIDGALFFSRRSAAIFATLIVKADLEKAARNLAYYAISETAGEPLRRLGAVKSAVRPDAESLIALIGR